MNEVAAVIDREGNPIYWSRGLGGSIEDSSALWHEVLWPRRDEILGMAHSHPGSGPPHPSHTDVTTFAAIEQALGRKLTWWICSSDCVAIFRWVGPGPYAYGRYDVKSTTWLYELRGRSEYEDWRERGTGQGFVGCGFIDEGTIELSPEESARFDAAIAQADSERPPHPKSIVAQRLTQGGYCVCPRGEARRQNDLAGTWPGGYLPDIGCARFGGVGCDEGRIPTPRCPDCDARAWRTETLRQQFPYGAEPNTVMLEADVEVETCTECGFQMTGAQGEEARDAAVRRYLKL